MNYITQSIDSNQFDWLKVFYFIHLLVRSSVQDNICCIGDSMWPPRRRPGKVKYLRVD